MTEKPPGRPFPGGLPGYRRHLLEGTGVIGALPGLDFAEEADHVKLQQGLQRNLEMIDTARAARKAHRAELAKNRKKK